VTAIKQQQTFKWLTSPKPQKAIEGNTNFSAENYVKPFCNQNLSLRESLAELIS
jgi:hypothetical protein